MRQLALLALVTLCAGCGATDSISRFFSRGEDNAEPPAPLVDVQSRINVIRLWSGSAGDGTSDQYLKLAPVVAGQRLFVAEHEGEVYAFDVSNGRKLWSVDVDVAITGGPGFGENSVLVGSKEGDVISLAADNGRKQWRATVSSEVLSSPLKADGVVVVRTNDGKVFALNGSTGERLWVYDRTVPPLTLRGTSTPAVAEGAVVAGFDVGRLAALELSTGRLVWETSVATARGRSELERMVDIDSDPLIIDGVIYVVTFQGQLSALQLESGRVLWSRGISSYAGFAADDNHLYLTDADSHVWAFDRYTGGVVWNNQKLHARMATAPASVGDYVVVGDLEGYLHWMSKGDGTFAARTRLSKNQIIVQPAVAGRVLYAYSSDGTLAAYTYR